MRYDYEGTVQALMVAIRDPVMATKYKNRVGAFFYVPKTSRCEEVARAILAMG